MPTTSELSTPCNGFRYILAYLGILDALFQLHVMDSHLLTRYLYQRVSRLSTPCNGFPQYMKLYKTIRDYELSTPCNGFELHERLADAYHDLALSTPCNGFASKVFISPEFITIDFQLHVMDSQVGA